MKRLVLVAVGAIALLGVAAIAAIMLMTGRPGRTSDAAPAAGAPTPAAAPPPAPAAVLATENVLGRPPPVPALPARPATPPAPPPPGSWEAVDPVGRAADLGAIGPPVAASLRNASDRLAACFEAETEARYSSTGAAPARMTDVTSGAIGGPPVLMLELETHPGVVHIVDAPLEWQGTAGDGVVLCAQDVLRGMRIAAPQAKAGGRHRMRYALMP